jgi:hypothetical protein
LSECRRFFVADALHLDREVVEALAGWAAERDLRMQDAIQLAICAFNDTARDPCHATASPTTQATSSWAPGETTPRDSVE